MAALLVGNRQALPDPRQLARKAASNPALIDELLDGLKEGPARKRFGCFKALHLLSEQRPDLLYPYFDAFVRLLGHENKIYQWEATFVLSQLAGVDPAWKFNGIFERYFAPIPGPVMISAANAIRGGARVARARPELADRIAAEILKVARARYATPECRNVAIGHAVVALEEIMDSLQDRTPVLQFVRKQLRNSRPSTRGKARNFLKRAER